MWQARLTLPVLLVVLAVTPPLLLRSAGEHDDEYSLKGQTVIMLFANKWRVCFHLWLLKCSTMRKLFLAMVCDS